jgi:hypothetical protein
MVSGKRSLYENKKTKQTFVKECLLRDEVARPSAPQNPE